MFNLDFLKQLLIISIALSTITCAFIQKTKIHFKSSKCLPIYSFIINIVIGITFCISFTDITFPNSLWVGLFSFLGADSLYKSLEGKLASYSDIINRNKVTIPSENIINRRIHLMEKPLYPSKYMRITQSYETGSHIDSYAIDEACIDQGISTLTAPFTGIIKKIYSPDANEVWLESTAPVEYPDGTIDYLTIMLAHSNDVSNLFVGKKINRGEPFYTEGTKGQATGNHVHLECGKGRFTGTGWTKNPNGNYSINNKKKPEECLWIDSSTTIIDNKNLKFKMIPQRPLPAPEEPIKPEPPPETTPEGLSLIFTCEKKGLYGIYLSENDKVYLKKDSSS